MISGGSHFETDLYGHPAFFTIGKWQPPNFFLNIYLGTTNRNPLWHSKNEFGRLVVFVHLMFDAPRSVWTVQCFEVVRDFWAWFAYLSSDSQGCNRSLTSTPLALHIQAAELIHATARWSILTSEVSGATQREGTGDSSSVGPSKTLPWFWQWFRRGEGTASYI